MANVSQATTTLQAKAVAGREAAKAILDRHGIRYSRCYSSYRVGDSSIRVKLWDVVSKGHSGVSVMAADIQREFAAVGFRAFRAATQHSNAISVIGEFSE